MAIITTFRFESMRDGAPHILKFWDQNNRQSIQGTTGMGRLNWFFSDLEQKLLFEQEMGKPASRSGRPFRILIAPCSIGVQTIELALRLERAGLVNGQDFEIYGLDINARFIQAAREETFPEAMIDWVPKDLAWIKNAFQKAAGLVGFCKLAKDRTGMVTYWEPQSLAGHDPSGNGEPFYDAVICSHLLYHLDAEQAKNVIHRMADLVHPGGLIAIDTGTLTKHDFLAEEFINKGFVGTSRNLNPKSPKNIQDDIKRMREKANIFVMARPYKTIAGMIGSLIKKVASTPAVTGDS